MSSSSYNNTNAVTYRTIQDKKLAGGSLSAPFISRAVVHEAKIAKNFQNAEVLYKELDTLLLEKKSFKENYIYSTPEVGSYQRAITTLVRYAPSPEKALQYATKFLQEKDEPFRTAAKELVVLTNLIYVNTSRGTEESMRTALEVTKLALEIGVFKIDPKHYIDLYSGQATFGDSLEVFEVVIQRVLSYFKLELNSDKSELVRQGSQR